MSITAFPNFVVFVIFGYLIIYSHFPWVTTMLTISWHLYFSHISNVLGMWNYGSVGKVTVKNLFIYLHILSWHFVVVFDLKMCVFIIFISFPEIWLVEISLGQYGKIKNFPKYIWGGFAKKKKNYKCLANSNGKIFQKTPKKLYF